jgi:hypothetical protein
MKLMRLIEGGQKNRKNYNYSRLYRSNDWKKFKIAKRERFVAKMKKYKIR